MRDGKRLNLLLTNNFLFSNSRLRSFPFWVHLFYWFVAESWMDRASIAIWSRITVAYNQCIFSMCISGVSTLKNKHKAVGPLLSFSFTADATSLNIRPKEGVFFLPFLLTFQSYYIVMSLKWKFNSNFSWNSPSFYLVVLGWL